VSAPLPPVDELKVRARVLLAALRSADAHRRAAALARFRAWPPLARLGLDRVRLKHAFAVVSREAGFDSWAALKRAAEAAQPDRTERLVPRHPGGFLNAWFASYAEARACRAATNGFLLPYRAQFFVCGERYIAEALGLDPADPDWARIERDWARPRERAAWQRLSDRLDAGGGR
jgi:hypothetical protein